MLYFVNSLYATFNKSFPQLEFVRENEKILVFSQFSEQMKECISYNYLIVKSVSFRITPPFTYL